MFEKDRLVDIASPRPAPHPLAALVCSPLRSLQDWWYCDPERSAGTSQDGVATRPWINNPPSTTFKPRTFGPFAALLKGKNDFVVRGTIRVAFVVYPIGGSGDIVLASKLYAYLSNLSYTDVTILIPHHYRKEAVRFFKGANVVLLPNLTWQHETKFPEVRRLMTGYDLYLYLALSHPSSVATGLEFFKDENPDFFNVATFGEYNMNCQELLATYPEVSESLHHVLREMVAIGTRRSDSLDDYCVQFSKMVTFPLGHCAPWTLLTVKLQPILYHRPL